MMSGQSSAILQGCVTGYELRAFLAHIGHLTDIFGHIPQSIELVYPPHKSSEIFDDAIETLFELEHKL